MISFSKQQKVLELPTTSQENKYKNQGFKLSEFENIEVGKLWHLAYRSSAGFIRPVIAVFCLLMTFGQLY